MDKSNIVYDSKDGKMLKLQGLTEFPSELYQQTKLVTLDLGLCKFERLPSGISALSGLRHLSMRGKSLRYLPENIGELKELRTLILKNTGIRELPDSFFLCPISKNWIWAICP